jgi:hypothetical protein
MHMIYPPMDNPPSPAAPPPAGSRTYTLADKPGKISAIILLTLMSGVFNIFASLAGTAALVTGTLGLGLLCCAPFAILPFVLGVFEVLHAFNLMASPPGPVQPNRTLSILEILTIFYGNVFSVIVGIVTLVFYSEPEVKNYFARINSRYY